VCPAVLCRFVLVLRLGFRLCRLRRYVVAVRFVKLAKYCVPLLFMVSFTNAPPLKLCSIITSLTAISSIHVTLNLYAASFWYVAGSVGDSIMLLNCGALASPVMKNVVSVTFLFPDVSFAIIVRLYVPGTLVFVKLNWYMSSSTFTITKSCTMLSGRVMLINTISTCTSSVTFAFIVTFWLMLKLVPSDGDILITLGFVMSSIMNVVFSVLLIFPLVSYLTIVLSVK